MLKIESSEKTMAVGLQRLPTFRAFGFWTSREDAFERAKALSLRVMADRLEHGESCRRWAACSPFYHELSGDGENNGTYSLHFCTLACVYTATQRFASGSGTQSVFPTTSSRSTTTKKLAH